MIELTNVVAKGVAPGRPAAPLRNVSLSWGRGVLAIVGAPIDGGATLLGVVAGTTRSSAGRVLVHGAPPDAARARIAHVPVEPFLPDALAVDELCALSADIRSEPRRPASERLGVLGLESLARRKVRSLSPGEAHAVALSLALTSKADVLLIEEPLASLDPIATSRVGDALRARATEGACVLMTTASVRDASRIADHVAVMTRGTLAPLPPALALAGRAGASVRVVVPAREGAASLLAALAADASVSEVQTAAYMATPSGDIAILARGPDLLALASAVTRAVSSLGVAVSAIETDVLPLDAIRAAMAAPSGAPR